MRPQSGAPSFPELPSWRRKRNRLHRSVLAPAHYPSVIRSLLCACDTRGSKKSQKKEENIEGRRTPRFGCKVHQPFLFGQPRLCRRTGAAAVPITVPFTIWPRAFLPGKPNPNDYPYQEARNAGATARQDPLIMLIL
jgi:hypothetical protein